LAPDSCGHYLVIGIDWERHCVGQCHIFLPVPLVETVLKYAEFWDQGLHLQK